MPIEEKSFCCCFWFPFSLRKFSKVMTHVVYWGNFIHEATVACTFNYIFTILHLYSFVHTQKSILFYPVGGSCFVPQVKKIPHLHMTCLTQTFWNLKTNFMFISLCTYILLLKEYWMMNLSFFLFCFVFIFCAYFTCWRKIINNHLKK